MFRVVFTHLEKHTTLYEIQVWTLDFKPLQNNVKFTSCIDICYIAVVQ